MRDANEDILLGLQEHLRPIVPMIQYRKDFHLDECVLIDDTHGTIGFGPMLEVAYPLHDLSAFHIGATITISKDGDIWVSRNTHSGMPNEELFVDPADPGSFNRVAFFLDPSMATMSTAATVKRGRSDGESSS